MVEVFITNVQNKAEARMLVAHLKQHYPDNKINIDLHDCDKILRMEGKEVVADKVVDLVNENGFACKLLD